MIVHTGDVNSDGANSSKHGLYSFGKLPALSRNTVNTITENHRNTITARTNNQLPKPKAVVSGQNQAFKERLKSIRAIKKYMPVTPNYVEGKISEI